MNENINLCEMLKGHEGETFYSPLCGNLVLMLICNTTLIAENKEYSLTFYSNGTYYKKGEMLFFPSKDQRDWDKWVEEQKNKVPKTWSELVKENKYQPYFAEIHSRFSLRNKCAYGKNSVEKSAAALLKIHQLIEVGYGGNVTYEEWDKNYTCVVICYDTMLKRFVIGRCVSNIRHIAFHTEEQAKEFLSKPENVQLLKDYFMI